MRVQLNPSWFLTTEHAQSSYRIPVLVDDMDNAYFPKDLVKPDPTWGYIAATTAVERMTTNMTLTPEQQQLVNRFLR